MFKFGRFSYDARLPVWVNFDGRWLLADILSVAFNDVGEISSVEVQPRPESEYSTHTVTGEFLRPFADLMKM